ncbi:hypothetical protein BDV27DRAFT_158828 [Aspergillus caelatus]|uniref:DUF6536 domain-containing protein n=1 Tax=Aspergillus caelatus TaxID=61420 RepID=A0A5N7A4I3_9EURO|nr:uncharacterized protein BDV27DRAFT_158828 [Aspergillus caelatus]KAE8363430.1 hypothetical protein BDV27DRAFT_158828 [Aspergillus caelatus]
MELTPLRRDAEALMRPNGDSSKHKDYQHEFRHPDIQPDGNRPMPSRERFVGWRRTLLLGCVISVVVLVFNLGFALWAVQHRHVHDGQGVLYAGDCKKVRNAGIGFHLVINILSTALLSASNYCMVLGAPTRKEVDTAHQKGQWLDVGVLSVRNLSQIAKKRFWLWMCLAFSSLPLHLMYNSTVFSSVSANAYNVFAANGSPNGTALSVIESDFVDNGNRQAVLRLHAKAQNGTLYQLENSACVNAYATAFQSTYGSLILVTGSATPADHFNLVYTQQVFKTNVAVVGASGYNWICEDLEHHQYEWQLTPCITSLPDVQARVAENNWTVGGYKSEYCLVEEATPHCKLQYSLYLVVIVIAFNIVKAIVLCYVAFNLKDSPLLTTGDAVSSFLRAPDQCSRGRCLLSMESVRQPSKYSRTMAFDANPRRWRSAMSRRRWSLGITCYSVALGACGTLLALGLILSFDSTGIWSVGLGQTSTQTLISSGGYTIPSVVANSLVANLPQLIFSMLYFACNGLITTMALAHEWSQYANQRKGLRVSAEPMGTQRSTYFLSLPYRYAIPFIIVSTLVHWLISESLFLVMIEAYTVNLERDPTNDIITCGYSAVAIVATISVGAVALGALIGLSFRRFKSGMPVAGSCSLAIAASCHANANPRDLSREDESALPLQWGEVGGREPVRHCTFSSAEVYMPQNGRVYQ